MTLLNQIFFYFLFSYTQRVFGNGIKAQSGNPEVRVKGSDPVINQIIDKLRHVIQVSVDLLLKHFLKSLIFIFHYM